MRRFVYVEAQEGGADARELEQGATPSFLRGWLDKDNRESDLSLISWMDVAPVGQWYEHRMGWCFCVDDDAGESRTMNRLEVGEPVQLVAHAQAFQATISGEKVKANITVNRDAVEYFVERDDGKTDVHLRSGKVLTANEHPDALAEQIGWPR